jgi:hypothetical protein
MGEVESLGVLRLRVLKSWDASFRMTFLLGKRRIKLCVQRV